MGQLFQFSAQSYEGITVQELWKVWESGAEFKIGAGMFAGVHGMRD